MTTVELNDLELRRRRLAVRLDPPKNVAMRISLDRVGGRLAKRIWRHAARLANQRHRPVEPEPLQKGLQPCGGPWNPRTLWPDAARSTV